MGYSPKDLDTSLDDLIKKKRKSNKNDNSKKSKQPAARPPIQTNKAKVTKPRNDINSRLSPANKKSGPVFTAKNKPQQQQQQQPQKRQEQPQKQSQSKPQKTDPAKIIITKNMTSSTLLSRIGDNNKSNESRTNDDVKSVVRGRLGNKAMSLMPPTRAEPVYEERRQTQREPIYEERIQPREPIYEERRPLQYEDRRPLQYEERRPLQYEERRPLQYEERRPIQYEERRPLQYDDRRPSQGFKIRGLSNSSEPLPVRDESSTTTVLVTGLDHYANSNDVWMFLEERFGPVKHCQVLKNRFNESYGEAEVQFVHRESALDCYSTLDNQMADGRVLRVILRETKQPQTYPQQNFAPRQMRSVISSVSGRLYADQMPSRYDIHRQ